MSIKSLIQIVIIIIIIIILGSVYYKYFSNDRVVIEEISELSSNNEQSAENEQSGPNDLLNNDSPNVETRNSSTDTNNINLDDDKKKGTSANETNLKSGNDQKNSKKEKVVKKKKKKQVDNPIKEVEYLTTDRKGNKHRIFAKSGKTNQNNKNVLDLDNVRGTITSEKRSNIYFVADFAEYNSSNQSSKLYQNVIITYDDKQITCDNFDIDMETNLAIAYNNVVVTDPKSIMKAGKITLDIETKDINIYPDNEKSKVKVVTN
jgi:LPS export ABC transporter protein LptC